MDYLKKIVTNLNGKKQKNDSRTSKKPLIENSDSQEGYRYETQVDENIINKAKEQRRLGVAPCAVENGEQALTSLISEDLSDSFPEPPLDLDQNLEPHFQDLNEALDEKLQRIRSTRGVAESMEECLIKKCHQQMFEHLQRLLQNVSTSKNCLRLINWVSQKYQSQDILCHPAKPLLDEWDEDTNAKLLQCLEKEVPESLDKILQTHSGQMFHNDERYNEFNVDVVQFVDGKLKSVRNISTTSYEPARKICFQHLLDFVTRFVEKQEKLLSEEKQRWKKEENMETLIFLKTLKTCKELGNYVQPKRDDIQLPVQKETAKLLENLQMFSLDLLKEMLTDKAETGVKHYLKSGEWSHLQLKALTSLFPTRPSASEEQKIIINEAYKIFSHAYLRDLLRVRQRRLKSWMQDVGRRVHVDAERLHITFSELAPGVQPWNLFLLKIKDVLDSEDIEGLKVTIAMLQAECAELSVCGEDLCHLPDLLRWKGLSQRKVTEVLEALPSSDNVPAVKIRNKTRCFSLCFCK